MNALLIDSAGLRRSKRSPQTPFRSAVRAHAVDAEILCTRAVRAVPGRRLVCFGRWRDEEVVAKFFLNPRRGRRHLQRELAGLAALASAGIPCPAVVFQGEVPPGRLPVLGLRRVSPALSFEEAWEQAENDDRRRSLLGSSAALVADQHQAGIKQDDLHGANFLVCGDQVIALDGASVDTRKLGIPLAVNASLKNLALLFAFLPPQSDHLIEDAFRIYVNRRAWHPATVLLHRLGCEVSRQRERQRNAWLEKIFRESTPFVCRRSWDRIAVCARSDFSPAMEAFLADPDPVMENGRRLKDGNSATVSLVTLDGTRFAVKRYNLKSARHRMKRCLRLTRAEISWENAHLLMHVHVPTPRPVALLVRRWGPFRSTAYFICEYVEGPDLKALLHAPAAGTTEIARAAGWLGDILQTLADYRISHGDLKATNFIVAQDRLWVVDLDGMRRFRSIRRFRRAFAADLDRLMQNWTGLPAVEGVFREHVVTLQKRHLSTHGGVLARLKSST